MRASRLTVVLLAIVIFETGWLLYPSARAVVLQSERSDAARGRELAGQLGCFNCHGPNGGGGVPNPGSRWQTVPGFGEQTLMMFVHGDEDLREYILDGAPAKKLADPSYREQMQAQSLRMPAFRGWISGADVNLLVAYLRSASEMLNPPQGTAAARGATLAREHGCFNCHGEMGAGGLNNPGSLKGYIPGFFGSDFADLVRNDEELKGWIRDGGVPRLTSDPVAKYFLERQRIKMPGFKGLASDEEIEAVAAYVRWLADGSWRTAPLS